MKKLTYFLALVLISSLANAQFNKNWEVTTTINTSATGAVDNWMYSPELSVSYKGFGVSASPLYQSAVLWNESSNLKQVGYQVGAKKYFDFETSKKTKRSGIYLFYNYINRSAVTDYRLQKQLDQHDFNTGKKEFDLQEHYAGFGLNVSLTNRIYLNTSFAFGVYQTSEYTDYNIDMESFKTSSFDSALRLEAGVGFLILKK